MKEIEKNEARENNDEVASYNYRYRQEVGIGMTSSKKRLPTINTETDHDSMSQIFDFPMPSSNDLRKEVIERRGRMLKHVGFDSRGDLEVEQMSSKESMTLSKEILTHLKKNGPENDFVSISGVDMISSAEKLNKYPVIKVLDPRLDLEGGEKNFSKQIQSKIRQ